MLGVDKEKDEVSKWISCEEKLPDDLVEVLYFAITNEGTREIMTGHRNNGNWTHCCLFYSTRILIDCKVTHWQPLPEPPIDKDGNNFSSS
jgi:hypothetical protein